MLASWKVEVSVKGSGWSTKSLKVGLRMGACDSRDRRMAYELLSI